MEVVSVRFEPAVIDLLDAELKRMAAAVRGWKPKRCDAVRALVQEALDSRRISGKR
jgi:hypothetical protein